MAKGFSDRKLDRLARRPRWERGLGPWASWESERTGYGLGFRVASGFPFFLPLFFSSDHYVAPITNLRENEVNSPFGVFFSWNSRKVEKMRAAGVVAELSSHPWTYLGLNGVRRKSGRGTLVFLPHSTPNSNVDFRLEALISELGCLPEKYRPFTLCVGSQDSTQQYISGLRAAALPIVTAGDILSQLFPFRFWGLLRKFSYTAGFSVGSHTYYSIYAGIPFRLFAPEMFEFRKRTGASFEKIDVLQEDYPEEDVAAGVRIFRESLMEDLEVPSKSQTRHVSELFRPANAIHRGALAMIIWRQFFVNWRSALSLWWHPVKRRLRVLGS